MRIQHNIMAMNAYRNLTGNQGALAKNLEKLSSGYRINRAGDDAAGLAISEKMRSQITGLEAAQKNVKDGVSLVKTAEGAMQEIHDMLGRMKYLATQSANGTYDNEVDRANIQKEVNSLKDEINRIADSANFNGQKLLDGSLSGTGAAGGAGHIDVSKLGVDITADAKSVAAIKGKWSIAKGTGSLQFTKDNKVDFTLHYVDDKGTKISKTITISQGTDNDNSTLFATIDGVTKQLSTKATSQSGKITSASFGKVLADALNSNDDIKNAFKIVASGGGAVEIEARNGGTSGAKFVGGEVNVRKANGDLINNRNDKLLVTQTAVAKDEMKAYDFAQAKVWNNTGKGNGTKVVNDLKDAIFEVNGKKFVFVQGTLTDAHKAELKEAGVEHWVNAGGDTVAASDIEKIVDAIGKETGLKVSQGTYATTNNGTFDAKNTGTYITFEPLNATVAGKGGLKLQIGDTSDAFNQMHVSVGDMHTAALGIADVDLGNQDGAAAAVQKINDAINSVSSVRGDLGAIQNRLEHTEKNLSVMQENIQNAESAIRDTDVAAEMMQYTKNNILIQSAQAMLAQANQVPQGVLQLLQ